MATLTYDGNTIVLEESKEYLLKCKDKVFKTNIEVSREDLKMVDIFYHSVREGTYPNRPLGDDTLPPLVLTDDKFILTCAGLKAKYDILVIAYNAPTFTIYGDSNAKGDDATVYVNGNKVGSFKEDGSPKSYKVYPSSIVAIETVYDLTGAGTNYQDYHVTTGHNGGVSFVVTHNGYVSLSYTCFIKGTQITLADGKTKPIQDITYDDKLLVWDFDNGCYSSAYPLWICSGTIAKRYYHLIFDNGKTLDVIIDNRGLGHRVFCLDTNRFEYSDKCVGKLIATEDGVTRLLSCEVVELNDTYHNIITGYHMNIYANSILTSTGLNNIYPIKDMRFVKEERELIPFDAFKDCPEKYYYGLRLGEQVEYTMERLNEKIGVIKNAAIENRYQPLSHSG